MVRDDLKATAVYGLDGHAHYVKTQPSQRMEKITLDLQGVDDTGWIRHHQNQTHVVLGGHNFMVRKYAISYGAYGHMEVAFELEELLGPVVPHRRWVTYSYRSEEYKLFEEHRISGKVLPFRVEGMVCKVRDRREVNDKMMVHFEVEEQFNQRYDPDPNYYSAHQAPDDPDDLPRRPAMEAHDQQPDQWTALDEVRSMYDGNIEI